MKTIPWLRMPVVDVWRIKSSRGEPDMKLAVTGATVPLATVVGRQTKETGKKDGRTKAPRRNRGQTVVATLSTAEKGSLEKSYTRTSTKKKKRERKTNAQCANDFCAAALQSLAFLYPQNETAQTIKIFFPLPLFFSLFFF